MTHPQSPLNVISGILVPTFFQWQKVCKGCEQKIFRPSTTTVVNYFPRVVTTSKLIIFFHPRVVTTSKLTIFFQTRIVTTSKFFFFFHPRVVTTSKLTIFFHPRVVTISKLTIFFHLRVVTTSKLTSFDRGSIWRTPSHHLVQLVGFQCQKVFSGRRSERFQDQQVK